MTIKNKLKNLSKQFNLNLQTFACSACFTMAEILLSLTIIGVVAAITLPSLTGNINERTWNTQRKALYARISQAIALMPALNGYGTPLTTDETEDTSNTVAMSFLTEGLSKVLKMNNICDHKHLSDCGLAPKYTTLNKAQTNLPKDMDEFYSPWRLTTPDTHCSASYWSTYNTMTAAFETVNGESVLVVYQQNCTKNTTITAGQHFYGSVCANFLYDLNGAKGPNAYGKDMGTITVFFPYDPEVVMAIAKDKTKTGLNYEEALAMCRNLGGEYKLPNIYEAEALVLNRYYVGWRVVDNGILTSTKRNANEHWAVGVWSGFNRRGLFSNMSSRTICILR